jgi:acyl dehydratase
MNRLLTPELEAMIGSEAVYSSTEPLGRASIRYFATVIGANNPLYTDREAARRAGFADVIAPPTLICETNQYMDRPRDEDGYIGHLWDIEVPGTRLIRGGNEYEFHQPVYPSDCITAFWRIADMSESVSAAGLAMLFVFSGVRYTNQNDELLAVNRETNIYQEMASDV